MFESYLLYPPALAAFLGALENGANVTPKEIDTWMADHAAQFPLIDKNKRPTGAVDDASLLAGLVKHADERPMGVSEGGAW